MTIRTTPATVEDAVRAVAEDRARLADSARLAADMIAAHIEALAAAADDLHTSVTWENAGLKGAADLLRSTAKSVRTDVAEATVKLATGRTTAITETVNEGLAGRLRAVGA
jgi:hypothetical protein